MRLLAAVIAAESVANNDRAALYALVGVVAAAFLTAFGGVLVAYLGRKRDQQAERLDKTPGEVGVVIQAYSDCRQDLAEAQERIAMLTTELRESRDIAEFLLREAIDKPEQGS